MMKNQKGIAPVLALGLVVVVSSVMFFIYKNFGISKLNLVIPLTRSQANREGWETYINKKYSFSIDYPENWKVEESETGVTISDISSDGLSGKLILVDATNINNVSQPVKNWLDSKYEEYSNCEGPECYGIANYHFVKEVSLGEGNYSATKSAFQNQGELSTFRIEYYIPHNGQIFTIQLNGNTDEEARRYDSDNFDEQNTETAKSYKEILSTFKFI